MTKVIMLADCTEREYNDSYAARLIEQGKAVAAPANETEPDAEDAPKKSGQKRR